MYQKLKPEWNKLPRYLKIPMLLISVALIMALGFQFILISNNAPHEIESYGIIAEASDDDKMPEELATTPESTIQAQYAVPREQEQEQEQEQEKEIMPAQTIWSVQYQSHGQWLETNAVVRRNSCRVIITAGDGTVMDGTVVGPTSDYAGKVTRKGRPIANFSVTFYGDNAAEGVAIITNGETSPFVMEKLGL